MWYYPFCWNLSIFIYPWVVYCDRPTQLYLKGRGERGRGEAKKIVVEHFPEASAWGVFVRRFRRRFRPEEFSLAGDLLWRSTLGIRIRIRIRIRILIYRFFKILRFVNFGRKLLRPKPLESVPQFFQNHFRPKASTHRSRSPLPLTAHRCISNR